MRVVLLRNCVQSVRGYSLKLLYSNSIAWPSLQINDMQTSYSYCNALRCFIITETYVSVYLLAHVG